MSEENQHQNHPNYLPCKDPSSYYYDRDHFLEEPCDERWLQRPYERSCFYDTRCDGHYHYEKDLVSNVADDHSCFPMHSYVQESHEEPPRVVMIDQTDERRSLSSHHIICYRDEYRRRDFQDHRRYSHHFEFRPLVRPHSPVSYHETPPRFTQYYDDRVHYDHYPHDSDNIFPVNRFRRRSDSFSSSNSSHGHFSQSFNHGYSHILYPEGQFDDSLNDRKDTVVTSEASPLDKLAEAASQLESMPEKKEICVTKKKKRLSEGCEFGVNDVLCGRGGLSNHHEGNIFFRSLVKKNRERYFKANKREKSFISLEVVETIKNEGGKFLKKVDKETSSTSWIEIDDLKAREKTSQALREGAAAFSKRQMLVERGFYAHEHPNAEKINKKRKLLSRTDGSVSDSSSLAYMSSPETSYPLVEFGTESTPPRRLQFELDRAEQNVKKLVAV